LEHLGRQADARRVETAVAADLAERGGSARSTSVIGDAIAARL
ncbi:MAG: 3-isopropylmalate dehydrogenase, partial [Dermatophilaceae bacterium]